MSAAAPGIPILAVLPVDEVIPLDLLTPSEDVLETFNKILVTSYREEIFATPTAGGSFELGLTVADEAVFDLPGLEGFALVVGGSTSSLVTVGLDSRPPAFTVVARGAVRLRFPRDWLRPVVAENGAWVDDPMRPFSELTLSAGVRVDQNWNVQFDGSDALALAPSMIGDTGFVIEGKVALDFSTTTSLPETIAMGLGNDFRGVILKDLKLHLPRDLDVPIAPTDLRLTNFHIGSGGLSGSVTGNWSPTVVGRSITGNGAGTLFGIDFGLKSLGITLRQSSLTGASMSGVLGLPFFDHALDVDVGLDLAGNMSLGIGSPTGIEEFSLSPGGVDLMDVRLDRLSVEKRGDVVAVGIGGAFTPTFGDVDWPTFEVKKLSIDSEGNVELEGGWLELPSQYSIDFFGFRLEITKLGFGKTDDGGKWIGFSGGLKLVEGMPAGASVDGLRITWYEDGRAPQITLDGVGVEFEVPNVLRFKGAVSYRELTVGTETVHRFDGDISLELTTLGLEIDAMLVVGSASGAQGTYTFFAIYLGVELPAGIPLWATGLGLFGMAGLFAFQMEPNRQASEPWYGVGPSDGWYKRPTIGVTDLRNKWVDRRGSLALGAGVTLGTMADNGFTFAGRVLLVLVFPGPILLIEGKANLLKERATLSEEPLFRALVVLDGRAGQLLIGLDAMYKFGAGGELIDIRGGAEAFYDFHKADAWHLYLGVKEPREKRIRAEIFKLFQANAYFMLDSRELALGAWVGYANSWQFGPLSATLEAWLEGNAVLSFKPVHFYGELWLHGKIAASVFGIGFSLTADARAQADVFDPFHLLFELEIGIDLPWFLPDVNVGVTLEWGPIPDPPPLPIPLKEVAVEHFKATTSWPLPRAGATPLLLPNYDTDADGFIDAPTAATQPSNLASAPVVPLDARPHITFGRAVHDDAGVGTNPQPVLPNASPAGWEWLGDPEKNEGPVRARYGLKQIALEKFVGGSTPWSVVAATPAQAGIPRIYGSWAPVPQLPSGQVAPGTQPPVASTKLWLWSKNPFDYTRNTSGAWDEWFTDTFDSYPCVPPPPDREVCCDFQAYPIGLQIRSPWRCSDHPEVGLAWTAPALGTVTALSEPVGGKTRALCFPAVVRRPREGEVPVTVTVDLKEPAKEVTVFTDAAERRRCVRFSDLDDRGPNPRTRDGIVFTVFDSGGRPAGSTRVRTRDAFVGLDCGFRLEIALPRAATAVDLVLTYQATADRVRAYAADGTLVDSATLGRPSRQRRIGLSGPGIVRVLVETPRNEAILQELCFTYVAMTATGRNREGGEAGSPTYGADGSVTVTGGGLVGVELRGEARTCVTKVCATLGPDPAEVVRHEQMTGQLVSELARWSQEGAVLEPNTNYRVRIVTTLQTEEVGVAFSPSLDQTREQTEFAYFRTSGPPGLATLSTPIGHPGEFDSGLDDLTRYVQQTVPPTVPPPGEPPTLPRPVYRAYDVGVRFNEDYVDLMYRAGRRDLTIALYDANNQPVRDAEGRLVVIENRWGVAETRTLTESERRWLAVVNESRCATLDESTFPPDKTLAAADGQVLLPDTVYEARLVPMLLHEDFSVDRSGWTVVDQGTTAAPSAWTVKNHPTLRGTAATVAASVVRLDGSPDLSKLEPGFDVLLLATDTARPSRRYRIRSADNTAKTVTVEGRPVLTGGSSAWEIPGIGAVVQTSTINGGSAARNDPVKPGTMLLRGATTWTDYRLSVVLRSSADGALGLVFRVQGPTTYYRLSMDRALKYRRLVRVVGGVHAVLAEDGFVYRPSTDYLVTVEAIGSSLRVYQDGELVFDVSDPSIASGRIGLYCWKNGGARFDDVRVDDFRLDAAVAYRFAFTTSQFTNVFHHLHSFRDEVWRAQVDVSALVGQAVALTGAPPTESEQRAYEALAASALGPAAAQRRAERVEITALDFGGQRQGLLVQSPEPIDWARSDLALSRATAPAALPTPPGALKLTDVVFGTVAPNEEFVDVLVQDELDPIGHRIEQRVLPGALAEAGGDPVLFADDFDSADSGLLFLEDFGPNALDHYTRVDEEAPSSLAPSAWAVAGGHIVQTGHYVGGGSVATQPDKPGTLAVLNASAWANVRIAALLRSGDYDDIGLVFRYDGPAKYYRFSMSRFGSYRRLVKKVGNVVTVLWQDQVQYTLGQQYRLVVETYGNRLIGWLDDVLLFNVVDSGIATGRVGFYCWKNLDAHFEGLRVEALESEPVLWEPAFTNMDGLQVVDEPGAAGGPSAWAASGGVLRQSSDIRVPNRPRSEIFRGTFVLGGDAGWEDVQIAVRLRSNDDDGIGVMFRYRDRGNYYRFAMDRQRGFRRLVRVARGRVTQLWGDQVQYTAGRQYDLTIRAVGSELRGFIDGVQIFAVYDGTFASGRVAFYSWENTGARFERVLVVDRTRRVGDWRILDEGANGAPSVWQSGSGALLQTSAIGGGGVPAAPGTQAIVEGRTFADQRVSVRVRSDQDGAVGVIVRFRDANNYYRLAVDSTENMRRLVKRVGGAFTTLWEGPGRFQLGEPFTITIEAIGSRLVGWIDRTRLFDVTDPAHASGRVGLYARNNPGARFERVEVREPPLEAFALLRDRFALGDRTGWTVVDEGTQQRPSRWRTFHGTFRQTSEIHSAPLPKASLPKLGTQALAGSATWRDVIVIARLRSLDDDTIGLLFRYRDASNYYRFSMDRRLGYRRLVKNAGGTFTQLWGDDGSFERGRTYELAVAAVGSTLRGFLDGVPLFVVEDTAHASGQIGLYTWRNSDARFSQVAVYPAERGFDDWLLDDAFVFLFPDRWTFVDEGTQGGASQWDVTSGELRQTGATAGGSTAASDPAKPGTYALAGDARWADYRVTVRLASDGANAIGVMFRHTGPDDYYRFSMDRTGNYRRLVKKVAGTFQTVWEDAFAFAVGREYVVTLDCVGDRLTGYLDGVRLFDVADGSHSAGRVGLYAWSNTGARFGEIRVARPVWTPYYVFAAEERVAAGTRIRVYAGNEASAPAEVPGLARRFAAAFDDPGRLRLPASGADLRLVERGGAPGHARTFLPATAYTPLSPATLRILRKADGTAFFLMREGTGGAALTPLDPGQHRLAVTYRRDNTAADPQSLILSQAGDRSAELVRLDLPSRTR